MAGPSGDPRPYTIDALARGLRVLKAFGPDRHELTLADVAETVQVSRGTAFRVARTLVEEGFLQQVETSRSYRLGPTAVSVGLETVASMTLPRVAEPLLDRLRDVTSETAQLAVPDADAVVLVARHPSRRFPPTTVYVGHRMPVHAGSLGRAMLAALEPADARTVVGDGPLAAATDKTRTDPTGVLEAVAAARRRGFAVNDQETTLEHRSLAAAVLAPSGRPVGAVNVSVSSVRMSVGDLVRRHAGAVVEAAADISRLLPETFAGRQYLL